MSCQVMSYAGGFSVSRMSSSAPVTFTSSMSFKVFTDTGSTGTSGGTTAGTESSVPEISALTRAASALSLSTSTESDSSTAATSLKPVTLPRGTEYSVFLKEDLVFFSSGPGGAASSNMATIELSSWYTLLLNAVDRQAIILIPSVPSTTLTSSSNGSSIANTGWPELFLYPGKSMSICLVARTVLKSSGGLLSFNLSSTTLPRRPARTPSSPGRAAISFSEGMGAIAP